MPPLDSLVRITTSFINAVIIILIILVIFLLLLITITSQFKKIKRISTEKKELGIKLQAVENLPKSTAPTSANEEYLQFIYNMSHEVANPLQSIKINLENMANSKPEEGGRWTQSYLLISNELKRLFALIENLRLLSRLETSEKSIKREPVNLKGVIEDVIMADADRASLRFIQLIYRGPERPARVLGNRDQLRQVLLNLIDNSIKYAKDSGGDVIISLQEVKENILIRVSDEGIGIPEEDIPFVFDTAYRAPVTKSMKRSGSGLGLAIAKRIIEQHGGEIEIQSKIGEGTTVLFSVPAYKPDS